MALIVPAYDDGDLYQKWHTRKIGASDAECIALGKTRFQTQKALWEYKTHRIEKEPQSEAMLAGLAAEPMIKKLWEGWIKKAGEPCNLLDEELPDVFAVQCDWADFDLQAACDFKYAVSGHSWEKAHNISLRSNFLLKGEINYFWIPAQHQLMVLGLPQMFYFVVDGLGRGEPVPLIVKRDDEWIAQYRAHAFEWFTAFVQMDREPPRGGAKMGDGKLAKLKLIFDKVEG